MTTSYKTPVNKGKKKPPTARLDASVSLLISPPLHESTKIERLSLAKTPKSPLKSASPSENIKSNSAKPKRVRRNYDKFKVGHEVDKKEGWVDDQGRTISVQDRIDALFKPANGTNPHPPAETSSNSDGEADVSELPPDPRYPQLIKTSLTTRDCYDAQRLVTRLNFIREDMDKMMKETSPRIEQNIKDLGERKKAVVADAHARLARIDREIEQNHAIKFPSATDISGERRTSMGRNGSFFTRPSMGDFVSDTRKRSIEELALDAQAKPSKGNEQMKRRRTISDMSIVMKPKASLSTGVIVTTSLHESEQEYVDGAVSVLGGYQINQEVSRTTTHLICGAPRKTMNVFRAMCRGCWIVTNEWVSASMEAGKWLPEEDYEAIEYFPNCRATRITRQEAQEANKNVASRRPSNKKSSSSPSGLEEDEAPGLSEILPIFRGCGMIYIAPDLVKPIAKDLCPLVRLCCGRLTSKKSEARVIIAPKISENYKPSDTTVVVHSGWVLESIMATARLPFERFFIPSKPLK